MNKLLSAAAAAALALAATTSPVRAADVGVSISVGQPGFYGRIDLGDAPRPRIIYAQPVLVERQRVRQAPIYLHVRPGHARHWKRHCHKYDACGQRVYFVNDNWYNTVYVDHHRQRRAEYERRDRRYDNDQQRNGNYGDSRRDSRRDDHRDGNDHDHDRGDRRDGRDHDRDGHRDGRYN